ncbi:MAG TPA: serine/threonine-protein kinase [Vicinamibacterales bacterium]|nr:serine/threonine-protein kinase [Vicinamibacterales bacterium]
MPIWARLVVAAAALRGAVAIAFYLAGIYNASIAAPLPAIVYAALVVTFSCLGLLLVFSARNDVRAAWLGGVLLLLAAPMTSRFLSQTPYALGTFLTRVQAGAFLPAFLWRFVCEFPSPLGSRGGRMARAAAAASGVFGAAAFAVNLSIAIWPMPSPAAGWRSWLATGGSFPSAYWPILLLTSAAAGAALIVRMYRSTGDDRTRVRIFAGGLSLGFAPLFVEIAIEELLPAYGEFIHRPAVEPWAAVVLFVPLALVPFITAYSVVYDRVVDTRLVIRNAIQHALAKYTIAVGTLIPFAALLFYLFHYRAEPLATLLSGPRPLVLIAAIAAGVASLRSRKTILHAIDRRFFREVYDAHLLVTTLVGDELMAGTPAEIAERLRHEIDRALHARADLYVLDDEGLMLLDASGRRPAIAAGSLLLSLAMADTQPMDVELHDGSLLSRLPDIERSWLEQGEYELLLPIRSRHGTAAGLLALTGKRSELPFSTTDRRSIGALAAPLSLAIENDRLRRGPDPTMTAPARECRLCSRLHAAGATRCSCGGQLAEAPVPHILRGIFEFDRRIGAGGMGVVYRATDLSLKRTVAIKTLPRLTSRHAAQLRREAQAMASLNHVNLAVIYGIESWRGTPFLIEEYLAGGTLVERLARGPLPIADALAIGATLAGVVGHLHANGIVHCDIKSSNIGFSQAGVLKLLDFGIAYLLRDAVDEVTATLTDRDDVEPPSVIVTRRGVIGTPAYMSPEAASGAAPVPAFDLWSLAVVLFEMIAARRPFVGRTADEILLEIASGDRPNVRDLRSDCPPAVAELVDRCLAPDFHKRPRNAEELRVQLLSLAPGPALR